MKPFVNAVWQFFRQIWSDAMLAVLLFVPLLMGLAFRFGLPLLECFLCERFAKAALLAPYFPVFDLLLCTMTPIMFSAAGALVLLDERESGISRAYLVSPLGRQGYLASRIGLPTLLAVFYCVAIVQAFHLSPLGLGCVVLLSLCAGAVGLVVSLMLPALAQNRVEGMALSKLSGLVMLGLPAALLLPAPFKYIGAILPSFWMTELALGGSLWNAAPALAASALLAALFLRRFAQKVL